ncbi:MAG: LptF/LptG family permease [Myxococcota bacterium]|nr:LptF/LptG family permease [Myxococcota bacterium]
MLLTTTALVWSALTVVLVSGQCVQMKSVLIHLDPERWFSLLSMGLVVMLEASVPLALLLACAWVFSRLREQNVSVVLASSNLDPRRILAMPLLLGFCSSILLVPIVTETAPRLISQIADLTKERAILAALLSPQNDGSMQRTSRRLKTESGTVDWFVGHTPGEERARVGRVESLSSLWNDSGPSVTFGRAEYWGNDVIVNVKEGVIRLDQTAFAEHTKVLTGPNSIISTELSLSDVHHHFVYHRRFAMLGTIPAWMILGSLFGLTLSRLVALSCATGLIGLSYWILRTGELACRAGHFSPILAAWLPTVLTGLLALVLVLRRERFAL